MGLHNPTISVIVPVYNTEKYLQHCIDSVLAQTFTDFELILVDDGSTDSSPAICDEYAKKDIRVRVFHKENGGVSSARNVGIEKAEGEWICFVDGDDYICDYFHLIQPYTHYDLITGAYKEFGAYNSYNGVTCNKVYNLAEDAFGLLDFSPSDRTKTPYLSSCMHLFKKEIIDNHIIRFNENLKIGEDTIFVTHYATYCKNAMQTSNIFYMYRKDDIPYTVKYSLNGKSLQEHIKALESVFNLYCSTHSCKMPQLYYSNLVTYIKLFYANLLAEVNYTKYKTSIYDAKLTYKQLKHCGRKICAKLLFIKSFPYISYKVLHQ